MLQWYRIGRLIGLAVLAMILVLLLAACGGNTDETPPDTPVPTPPPTPVLEAIATWTSVPSATLRPTLTLAPTMTSAVSDATFPPPPETGLSEVDNQVIVTILEADLNDVIARIYDANLVESDGPPVVTFEPGNQLAIEATFVNSFLDKQITVHVRVILEIFNDRIRLKELQENRDWSGPIPSDPAVWSVINLVERGINEAVFEQLRAQPGAGSLALINLRQFPASPQIRARLEAIFAE